MVVQSSDPAFVKPKSQQQQEQDILKPEIELHECNECGSTHGLNCPNTVIIATAQNQNQNWHEITEYVTMNFRGKKRSFNEIVIYVRKICTISEFADIVSVRDKEEKIGNLIADIYIQKSKAQYAYGKLEAQRFARLGKFVEVKDRRSTTLIEARMAAHDEAYQAILALSSDCKSTLDFWHDMYNICLRTTDRLKQISMALMAEMKLEPSDQGGRRVSS